MVTTQVVSIMDVHELVGLAAIMAIFMVARSSMAKFSSLLLVALSLLGTTLSSLLLICVPLLAHRVVAAPVVSHLDSKHHAPCGELG